MSLGKRLAYVLRHDPDSVGVLLDRAGWTDLDGLAVAMGVHPTSIRQAVADDAKGRYEIAEGRIRAVQGHSITVELGHAEATPPDVLYHGTTGSAWRAIQFEGLRPMARHAVHLSTTVETALAVAARRRSAVVLEVDAAAMVADGAHFTLSPNGVWLVPAVPAARLRRI